MWAPFFSLSRPEKQYLTPLKNQTKSEKMNPITTLIATILIVILSGCTTTSRVAVVKSENVRTYQSLGSVRSTFPLGGLFKNLTYSLALDSALEKAAKMGATHFVIDENSGPVFLAISETASGTAYRQPQQ
jgi:hypothetical protein